MVLSALWRMDPGRGVCRFQLRDVWAPGVISRRGNTAPGGLSPWPQALLILWGEAWLVEGQNRVHTTGAQLTRSGHDFSGQCT